MFVEQIMTGGDRNFAYIVAEPESHLAAVIDPSFDPARVFGRVTDLGMTIKYVLNTHSHEDHTNGNDKMQRLSGCSALSFGMSDPGTDILLADGAELPLGETTIHVIHTPGHTEESICYHVEKCLFTGDTLFVGKVGGTDFGEQAKTQYRSLHTKLMTLPDTTRVFPGHDVGVKPHSTIGYEKKNNPFLLRKNFSEFVELKKNWLQYKEEHGIQ
jgi:hydroxyacylglutathione hydrolase